MEIGISDIAYSLGSSIKTNVELEREYPHWNFEHLESRTGVKQRPISPDGETALDISLRACETLIDSGRLKAEEIDALIFCTETPDHVIPPNSCILHGKLGLKTSTIAFDITLACSGYPYTLLLAKSLISSGSARNVLVVNADTYSRLISPDDRSTRVLFGDGGAVSIITSENPRYLVTDVQLGTAGSYFKRFYVEAGGLRTPNAPTDDQIKDKHGNIKDPEYISMDGLGILTFFNSVLPPEINKFLAKNNMSIQDVDLMIPHQSSAVSLEGLRRALKIEQDRFVIDIETTGNLVSASIPTAFSRALEQKRIKSGDKVLLCGFGVGLSWGLTLIDVK
ncbi:MAG: ketoacyl-ACP synthase III [Lentilitoribacter sp.]